LDWRGWELGAGSLGGGNLEHLFTSLSKRQSMLLLTAVTFGGSESPASLEFLPDEEGELLRHRAAELLQIPRDKRIPLLVQEIKRLVNARKGQLWAADPQKLAEVLKGERPVLVEVLLKAFPVLLAEAVRALLPPVRARMFRDPRPEVLGLLRWKLEDVLARMGSAHAHFKFSDVLRLHSRELLTLIDAVGSRALGPALAGLPDADRDAALAAAAPDHRQLLSKALLTSQEAGRKLEEKDAREVLEPHGLSTAPAGLVRSSGVQRLSRACLAQGSEFAALLVEKYPGELGRLIARWVREERARAVNRGDGGRAEFVEEMERLEAMGLLSKPVRLAPAAKAPALKPPSGGFGPGTVPRGGPDAAEPRERDPRGPIVGGAAAAPRGPPSRQGPGAPPPQAPGATPKQALGATSREALGAPSGQIDPTREREAKLLGIQPMGSKRDWVAERRMRQAGMGQAPKEEEPRRDAIAERRMRSAGIAPSRSHEAVKERLPAPRPPAPRPTGEVTAPLPQKSGAPPVERPPSRAMTSPPTTRPPALRRPPSGEDPRDGPGGTSVARPPRVSGQHPAAKGRGEDDEP